MITLIILVGLLVTGLFITAAVVIALNRRMTGWGKLIRVACILFFPVLGPIVVLIEVLLREIDEDARKKASTLGAETKSERR